MARKRTIAIVYDERNVLTSLRLAFEAEGFGVRTYDDPVAALPELIAEPPSLAILNGRMPGMHGMELYRRLREHSDVPVIFISANADDIAATLRAPEMTEEDYIAAPFSQRLVVRRVLERLAHVGANE